MNDNLFEIVKASTCVILDVEGTTTSFDFVRNELFRYGETHMKNYVVEHWNDIPVQKVIKELLTEENKNVESNFEDLLPTRNLAEALDCMEDILQKILNQIKSDQKSSSMKELEGLVWKNGFINGDLMGHVYPDVIDALSLWSSQGKNIFIYSNGSIEAQCLLFRHSKYGNLGKYIHGNFDTNIGSKLDPASYAKICQSVGKLPSESVFFSDHPLEILAAKQSGLLAILVIRHPDNPNFAEQMGCLADEDPKINSFLEVIGKNDEKNE